MKYPQQLLPQKKYKIINCDISNSILIRHVDIKENDNELIDAETGNVKLQYIADPTRHIADYSTSLFGIFSETHLAIRLTKEGKLKYNDYCAPETMISPLIYNQDYELVNNRKYITLNIGNIKDKKINYLSNNKTSTGTCVVTHTPMKWNYWHFSVRWINENSEYLNEQPETLFGKPKTGWVRLLSSAARAMIAENAKAYIQEHKLPPKKCYMTSVSVLSRILYRLKVFFYKK